MSLPTSSFAPLDLQAARDRFAEALAWRGCARATIEAMREVRRNEYLPPALWRLAYADLDLWRHGLGPSPHDAAQLMEAADPGAHERCLEIGGGAGWFADVLARRCRHVTSVGRTPAGPLPARSAAWFVNRDALATTPAAGSLVTQAQLVVLSFAPARASSALLKLLAPGARLVEASGPAPQQVTVTTRIGDAFQVRRLGRVRMGASAEMGVAMGVLG